MATVPEPPGAGPDPADGLRPGQGPATPAPITAPPAPQRLTAPHNLFTMAEITAALQLMTSGLEMPYGLGGRDAARVTVTWRNGGERYLHVGELAQITDVEDVRKIALYWRYQDGSSVTGTLVRQPEVGGLAVEDAGRALSSAHAGLDHLRSLRSIRAAVRGFAAGAGLRLVGVVLAVLVLVLLAVPRLNTSQDPEPVQASAVVVFLIFSAVVGLVVGWTTTRSSEWVRRRVGGTRLARPAQVQHTWLTQEVGVLATVVGVPIAILGLIATLVTS